MYKRNIKIVSSLAIFAIALNVLSTLVLLQPVTALSGMSDTMSSLSVSTAATHVIVVTSADAANDTATLTFPGDFTGTPIVTTSQGTCVALVCTATTVFTYPLTLNVAGLTNPGTAGTETINIDLSHGTTHDTGVINVVVVDSDIVNVTGYINTSLAFDIDTAVVSTSECDTSGAGACLDYDVGTSTNGYTVDLGELTNTSVNESGASMNHQGVTAADNYIFFDLSTNAHSGASVTVQSANARLDGPAATPYDIPSVAADGTDLVAGTPGYGIKLGANVGGPLAPTTVSGTISERTGCTDADTSYCELTTTPTELFGTSNAAVETARITASVGAAINGTMPAGLYIDTLTFIATATY